jgi:hypothetical protein
MTEHQGWSRLKQYAALASVFGTIAIPLMLALRCEQSIAEDKASSVADVHPFDLRPQPWQRRDKPALSANTTKQPWCQVVLYSPWEQLRSGAAPGSTQIGNAGRGNLS